MSNQSLRPRAALLGALVALAVCAPVRAPVRADDRTRVVKVRTRDELRAAAAAAGPGTRIEIAPGTYEGGLEFAGLRGEAKRPIVLAAADAAKPPVFRGGGNALHLVDPQYVELRDLVCEGQTGNGLNVDDGGTPETPAHHVILHGLVVRDVGPEGNRDGIKLSGGSAIDMVGCRRGTIERCVFRHSADASGASGVQAKGGSQGIAILRNRFEDAGGRAVNAGGSTGLAYFRPALTAWQGPKFEAQDLRIEGNTFVGGQTPVAFVGVDGATFRFNTVVRPGRWALRILQENREPGFVACRGGVFSDNVVVFRSDAWSEGGANVGPGTEPASFRFERNVWFCSDAPGRTRDLVRLPVPEKDGVHGKDPKFRDAEKGDYRLQPGSPAAKAGADAFRD